MLVKARKNTLGKNPQAVVKYLGNPVMQGKYDKFYRIIYLTKDMRRFYLNLSYNTDLEVDCLVFDFDAKNRLKSIQKFKKCNQKGGEILKFQDIDLK
jgi:outer membrane protein assembly factor BamE (lipoprotein component of BamABCDE complex)